MKKSKIAEFQLALNCNQYEKVAEYLNTLFQEPIALWTADYFCRLNKEGVKAKDIVNFTQQYPNSTYLMLTCFEIEDIKKMCGC